MVGVQGGSRMLFVGGKDGGVLYVVRERCVFFFVADER